jgi:hypothetical protein
MAAAFNLRRNADTDPQRVGIPSSAILCVPSSRNRLTTEDTEDHRGRSTDYESRKTRAGSVRAARHAGNRHADIAVSAITANADPNTQGSCGLTL